MLLVYFIIAFFSFEYLIYMFLTPIVCSYYNIVENKNLKSIASRLVNIIVFHLHVYLAVAYRGNVDEDHVFGKSNISTTFANYCIAYFIWDLKNTFYINNNHLHRILVFIHHVFGSFILYLIFLHNDANYEYYGLYYFGISEISSIPLTIMNFYKDYNLNKRKEYIIIQVLFIILFLLFRTVGFSCGLYMTISDLYEHRYDISMIFSCSIIVTNSYFTVLMYYWTYKIYKGLKKLIKSN